MWYRRGLIICGGLLASSEVAEGSAGQALSGVVTNTGLLGLGAWLGAHRLSFVSSSPCFVFLPSLDLDLLS
jgi:hypothetical protein